MAALPTSYFAGTASINAGETAVTGQGTAWLTEGLEPGDLFCAAGLSVRITAVNSNTSLTITPWPGANRAAAAYEVRFTPEADRIWAATREMLSKLYNGNLFSIAGLTTLADKISYYTGAGVAALADFTAFGRSLVGAANAGAALTTLGAAPSANPTFTGNVTFSGGVLPNSDNARVIGSASARYASVYALALRHCADVYGTDDAGRVIINGGATAAPGGAGASGGIVARGPTNAVNPGGVELFTGGSASLTLNNLGVMTVVPPVAANIVPSTDNTRAIGSATAKFLQMWIRQVHIGDDAGSNARLNLNGAVATNQIIDFKKAGLSRWQFRCNNAAESGSNAGSDIQLDRYNDAGSYVDTPFVISRLTGSAVFGFPPKITSFTVATLPSASAYNQCIAYVSNGTGNKRLAVSDGANWRFPDGAIVS